MRDIRVASVQMESVAGDKAANFEKVERFTAEAAARGARIVLAAAAAAPVSDTDRSPRPPPTARPSRGRPG
jgi:hypothetical protein